MHYIDFLNIEDLWFCCHRRGLMLLYSILKAILKLLCMYSGYRNTVKQIVEEAAVSLIMCIAG